ncbi:MAG TPA: ROK family protein [Actinocrinis sp.]|nr:ROK family protein [Actinocrinis sp.]
MTDAAPSAPSALAIDIGGTKLAAALVGPDGTVRRRAETPTPAVPAGQGAAVAEALLGLAAQVVGTERPVAVGVACAGPLDLTAGTASPVNIPAWHGFPLRDTMHEAFPGATCVLVGDAIAAAVGEHWRGAGQDARSLLGIVVSTGIGGGFVLGGRAFAGPTGNAGHIGHVTTDLDAVRCACGGTGCVEALASGPSMVRWAVGRGWRSDRPAAGQDAKALAEDAQAGHALALAAFDRAADALACGIMSAAALVDLDLVVVGGGVAAAGPILFDPLRAHLKRRASLDFVRRVRAVPGTLGRDAGLIGAARSVLLALEAGAEG